MKSIFYYFIFFLLLFIPLGELFCQTYPGSVHGFSRGFIIINRGDTVQGFIGTQYNTSPGTSCIFKSDRTDYPEVFGPLDLAGYSTYYNGQLFLSISVPAENGDNLLFIRILFDGTYDLLFYESPGKKHFLIRKPDNSIVDLTYPPALIMEKSLQGMSLLERFQYALGSVFSHTQAIQEYTKDVRPEVSSMIEYFKKYHELSGDSFTIYNGIKKSLYVGLATGVTIDNYFPNIQSVNIHSFPEPSPYAGIYAKLPLCYTGSGLFLQSSLGYKTHHYFYSTKDQFVYDYYEIFIKSLVSISRLGFTLNPVSVTKYKPFIEGGGLVCAYLNPRFDNYHDMMFTENNTAFSYYNNDVLTSSLYYGAFLRAGIMKILKYKNSIRLSAGYDYLMNSGPERIQSIDFSLTYMMKFN